MKILFVDCCIRGEASRTLGLCRAALDEIAQRWPEATVETVSLNDAPPLPMDAELLARRGELAQAGDFTDATFRFANQFKEADLIVIGAPYWEFQFPALLRCYFEQISVCGLTFVYAEDGRPQTLCKARRLLYVTTAGGPIGDRNCGYDYVRVLCGDLLGIPEIGWGGAEGLDIWGADVPGILAKAEADLRAQIRDW